MLREKITYKYCNGDPYNWEVTSGLFIVAKSLFKKVRNCSADIDIWDEVIAIENHAIERLCGTHGKANECIFAYYNDEISVDELLDVLTISSEYVEAVEFQELLQKYK
ncbi:hypothetical protein [Bacillus sp. FSL K6-0067]|uniref:hypothetical protein n=1 Tax=Bacillus sp. FSL K6-0067 TaxID=2921412 RepID=UPI00077A5123|nr:hypothetical protein AT267_00885 [Bacillus cereus]